MSAPPVWGLLILDGFSKSLTQVDYQHVHFVLLGLVLFGLISVGLHLSSSDAPIVVFFFFFPNVVLALECLFFALSLEILETHLFLRSFEVVLLSVLPGL